MVLQRQVGSNLQAHLRRSAYFNGATGHRNLWSATRVLLHLQVDRTFGLESCHRSRQRFSESWLADGADVEMRAKVGTEWFNARIPYGVLQDWSLNASCISWPDSDIHIGRRMTTSTLRNLRLRQQEESGVASWRWEMDMLTGQVVRLHAAMRHRAGLGMQEKPVPNIVSWLLYMCYQARRHPFAVGRVACYVLCPRDNRLMGNFYNAIRDSQAYQRRCRFPARTMAVHDDKSRACQTRLSPGRLLISHATIMPLTAEISVVCRPRECSVQQTGPATTHG